MWVFFLSLRLPKIIAHQIRIKKTALYVVLITLQELIGYFTTFLVSIRCDENYNLYPSAEDSLSVFSFFFHHIAATQQRCQSWHSQGS